MRIQIIVHDKLLIEHCNLRLWSIHEASMDKRGKMYVVNKTDIRKKTLVLDGEYKIIERMKKYEVIVVSPGNGNPWTLYNIDDVKGDDVRESVTVLRCDGVISAIIPKDCIIILTPTE